MLNPLGLPQIMQVRAQFGLQFLQVRPVLLVPLDAFGELIGCHRGTEMGQGPDGLPEFVPALVPEVSL